MAFEVEPDYGLAYPGSPGVGDRVEFDRAHDGIDGGEVVGTLAAPLTGVNLVVQIGEYPDGRPRTIDIHWQRTRKSV